MKKFEPASWGDSSFQLPELAGERVHQIFGLVSNGDPADHPILINVRLDQSGWHRFFLDVGFASWTHTIELQDTDPEGNDCYVADYAQLHSLTGEVVRTVIADCNREEAPHLWIEFQSGRSIGLAFREPDRDTLAVTVVR